MFDKKYKEGYSREEMIEALRQSVEEQRNLKRNGGNRYCYITNGVEVKMANPDLPIPQGWWRGCPKKKDRGIRHE